MALHFEEGHQYELNDAPDQATEDENFKLITMLRRATEQLAVTDLDRAKEIITALKNDRSAANEGYGYSQMLAAECVPALSAYDYEFARDTLLDIRYPTDEYNHGHADNRAMSVMIEFRQQLTPEQRADLNLHEQQRPDGS